MNNSLYTTIPKELEYLPDMTPDEEMEDYMREFDPTPDEYDIRQIDLFRVQSQLAGTFHSSGYAVEITSRPKDPRNPFVCTHGLETPKDEVEYLTELLDKFGIEYTVKEGAFKNVNGVYTNMNFAFVELNNGIEDYYRLYEKTDEIPYLVGDVIL